MATGSPATTRRNWPIPSTTIASWVKAGVNPPNTDYPTTVALFTSGDAPLMINGVWEVPTMVDLAGAEQAVQLGRDRAAGVVQSSLHL